MRQTALYQQYDAENRALRWILVQLPKNFETHLRQYLKLSISVDLPPKPPKPILLHTMLYISTSLHWRAYLNDLEDKLTGMVY